MSTAKKLHLSVGDILAKVANHPAFTKDRCGRNGEPPKVWGVPRGGVPIAMAVAATHGFRIAERPEDADLIVDDLEDSGATRRKYEALVCHWGTRAEFVPLYDKGADFPAGTWLCFPWEESAERDRTDSVIRVLEHWGIPSNPDNMKELEGFMDEWSAECGGEAKDESGS